MEPSETTAALALAQTIEAGKIAVLTAFSTASIGLTCLDLQLFNSSSLQSVFFFLGFDLLLAGRIRSIQLDPYPQLVTTLRRGMHVMFSFFYFSSSVVIPTLVHINLHVTFLQYPPSLINFLLYRRGSRPLPFPCSSISAVRQVCLLHMMDCGEALVLALFFSS